MVKSVEQCGNGYLSKGMAIESEVADTEGSTATYDLLFGIKWWWGHACMIWMRLSMATSDSA
jgi:hypothetical protein